MQQLGESRFIRALLSVALVMVSVPLPTGTTGAEGAPGVDKAPSAAGAPAPADTLRGPAPSQPQDLTASLDQAREFIKTRDYDNAIEVLATAIRAAKDPGPLREAYLLLIKTWVFLGAENEQRQQGRETAKLNYQKAKELIAECLSIKELRHARPEPVTEYPDKMISLFAEVRNEIFGSFRVAELHPPEAVVLLDADTLHQAPGESFLGINDIAAGRHRVVVSAKGHKDLTEEIEIKPGAILEQPYRLAKGRTRTWYALVGAGAAGLVALGIALTGPGETTSQPPPENLPGAPPPPARAP